MVLVILGAGASFDSAEAGTEYGPPPPLTKDLAATRFGSIAARYPQSRPVIAQLRARLNHDPTSSLEHELAKFVQMARDRPARREQLMAFRFYLQHVISQSTMSWLDEHNGFSYYLNLVSLLVDGLSHAGPVRVATFNYDTLLEAALKDHFLDWRFASLDDYVSRPDFRVFKLHGSIDWSQAYFHRQFSHSGSAFSDATRLAARVANLERGELLMSSERPPNFDFGEVRIPALAVPLADKTEFECPASHLTILRSDLHLVDLVLVIGWRAAETHAVELLDSIPAGFSLGIVSGSPADCEEVRQILER